MLNEAELKTYYYHTFLYNPLLVCPKRTRVAQLWTEVIATFTKNTHFVQGCKY